MISEQQILELTVRKDDLYRFLQIQNKEHELKDLEKESNQNGFWNNPKEAQKILKKTSMLKSWIKSYCLVEKTILRS